MWYTYIYTNNINKFGCPNTFQFFVRKWIIFRNTFIEKADKLLYTVNNTVIFLNTELVQLIALITYTYTPLEVKEY